MKKLLKISVVVLVQSLLLLDAIWAGSAEIYSAERHNLSAPIQINQQNLFQSFTALYALNFQPVRACNFCGGSEFAARLKKQLPDGGEYELLQCENCGLAHLSPQPTDKRLEEIYSAGYFKKTRESMAGYPDYLNPARQKKSIERANIILDKLEALRQGKKGTILDVGAAAGYFLYAAQQRGWKTKGIEKNRDIAGEAAAMFGFADLGIKIGGLEDTVTDEWGKIDAVSLNDVLEHLKDPYGALQIVYKLLAEEGVVSITIPLLDSLVGTVQGEDFWEIHYDHLYYFTFETLNKLLSAAGFEVLEIHTTDNVQFDKNFIKSLVSDIPNNRGMAKVTVYARKAGSFDKSLFEKNAERVRPYQARVKELIHVAEELYRFQHPGQGDKQIFSALYAEDFNSNRIRRWQRQIPRGFSASEKVRVRAVVLDVDSTVTKDGLAPPDNDNLQKIKEALQNDIPVLLISGSPLTREVKGRLFRSENENDYIEVINDLEESLQDRVIEAFRKKIPAESLKKLTIMGLLGYTRLIFDAQGGYSLEADETCPVFTPVSQREIIRALAQGYLEELSKAKHLNFEKIISEVKKAGNAVRILDVFKQAIAPYTNAKIWILDHMLSLPWHDNLINGNRLMARAIEILRENGYPEIAQAYYPTSGDSYAVFSTVRKADEVRRWLGGIEKTGAVIGAGDAKMDDFLLEEVTGNMYFPFFLNDQAAVKDFPQVIVCRDSTGRDKAGFKAVADIMEKFLDAEKTGRSYAELKFLDNQFSLTDLARQGIFIKSHGRLTGMELRELVINTGHKAGVFKTLMKDGRLPELIPGFELMKTAKGGSSPQMGSMTAWRHTEKMLEMLQAVADADYETFNNGAKEPVSREYFKKMVEEYQKIAKDEEKLFSLWLAVLFHDIGKSKHLPLHDLYGPVLTAPMLEKLGGLTENVKTNCLALVAKHCYLGAMRLGEVAVGELDDVDLRSLRLLTAMDIRCLGEAGELTAKKLEFMYGFNPDVLALNWGYARLERLFGDWLGVLDEAGSKKLAKAYETIKELGRIEGAEELKKFEKFLNDFTMMSYILLNKMDGETLVKFLYLTSKVSEKIPGLKMDGQVINTNLYTVNDYSKSLELANVLRGRSFADIRDIVSNERHLAQRLAAGETVHFSGIPIHLSRKFYALVIDAQNILTAAEPAISEKIKEETDVIRGKKVEALGIVEMAI